jgi:hypothetical protein
MDTIENRQLEKLLEDISSIKSVINRNKPLLQQVLNPAHFRLFALLAAISIIGFALVIYFLMQQYGSLRYTPHDPVHHFFSNGRGLVFYAILKTTDIFKIRKTD